MIFLDLDLGPSRGGSQWMQKENETTTKAIGLHYDKRNDRRRTRKVDTINSGNFFHNCISGYALQLENQENRTMMRSAVQVLS